MPTDKKPNKYWWLATLVQMLQDGKYSREYIIDWLQSQALAEEIK